MKYHAAVVATFLLVACDQRAPTEPIQFREPSLLAGGEQTNVSLTRNAEWISEVEVIVSGSFTCSEGAEAQIAVTVLQAKPNGQTASGSGSAVEICKFGSNKWSVVVTGGNWDKAPALATVQMAVFRPTGVVRDSDQGQITIR